MDYRYVNELDEARKLGLTDLEYQYHLHYQKKNAIKKEETGDFTQIRLQDLEKQNTKHLKQTTEELKRDLSLELSNHFRLQMEKVDQQWEQLQNKNSQVLDELRLQFQSVFKYVNDTAEDQTNNLKHYFMQEIDLLRQDVKKMLHDRSSNNLASPLMTPLGNKVNLQQNINNSQNSLFSNSMLPEEQTETLNRSGHIQHRKKDTRPDSLYDWAMEAEEEITYHRPGLDKNKESSKADTLPTKLSQNNDQSSASLRKADSYKSSISEGDKSYDADNPVRKTQSVSPLKEEPVAATGFYAEAISSQIKQKSFDQPFVSDKAGTDAVNNGNKAKPKTVTYTSSQFCQSSVTSGSNWNEFSIADSDHFSRSGAVYPSSFLYASDRIWKAQARIRFNAKLQMEVRICISKGDRDSSHEWPLKFTGQGYIFHKGSKRFTEIWNLPLVTCEKPSKEVEFPAIVCLETLRGSYPNPTYKELLKRLYAEDNKLIFRWNLRTKKRLQASKAD